MSECSLCRPFEIDGDTTAGRLVVDYKRGPALDVCESETFTWLLHTQ